MGSGVWMGKPQLRCAKIFDLTHIKKKGVSSRLVSNTCMYLYYCFKGRFLYNVTSSYCIKILLCFLYVRRDGEQRDFETNNQGHE